MAAASPGSLRTNWIERVVRNIFFSGVPMHLRKAIPADLPGITEVEQLSFVHAGERFTQKRVHYLIINPRSIVAVATHDNRILGWAAGLVWLRGREPWGRIYALAVHPQARGQRLGPRLLDDMIQSLRNRAAGRIFLEVRTDNHAAIRLYESVGFKTCRILHNYYGPDLPAQRMELPAAPQVLLRTHDGGGNPNYRSPNPK